MRAIPEVAMEFDNVYGREGTPISPDGISSCLDMFRRDPDYVVNEYDVPDGTVYAVFYVRDGKEFLSSYSWHVPTELGKVA